MRLRGRLSKLDLLVLDELRYVPASKVGAELLFDIISTAYERTSIIVTTNLPFENWTEVLGSELLTARRCARPVDSSLPYYRNERGELSVERCQKTPQKRPGIRHRIGSCLRSPRGASSGYKSSFISKIWTQKGKTDNLLPSVALFNRRAQSHRQKECLNAEGSAGGILK